MSENKTNKDPVRTEKTAGGVKNPRISGAQNLRSGKGENPRPRKPKAASVQKSPDAQKLQVTAQAVQSAPTGAQNDNRDKTRSGGGNNGQRRQKSSGAKNAARGPKVKIMALGGLNEIGKNMTVFECGDDMFIVDCGLAFPDDEMFGVDIVIPDFTFVEKNREKFRGIVITHGHEDHIGSLVYLLKSVNLPIYATRFTLALIEGKLKEHGLSSSVKLHEVAPGGSVKLGCMSAEFINVNHSIPGACAIAITTPAGVIIHTGDFKVDYTPIDGPIIDLARFGELGSKGVLALMSDSTNSEREGTTRSERTVGVSFDTLFKRAEGKRIMIATFSSNVHRVQQVADACIKYGRKLAISGRSMINVVTKARELGYLNVPDSVIVEVDHLDKYADGQIALVTTGSQGEPMSALYRMSMSDHRKVRITPNDFIIISASPIPGNEKTVTRVIDGLMKLGADVIYEKMYDIHVSGHACQDEQKLMIALTKPKFFIPYHGEFHHLQKHAQTAESMGIDRKNIFVGETGDVLETDGVEMKYTGTVPSGSIMVDGLGVGDVGSIVLRDRKHLGQDGLIIVVIAIDRATGEIVSGPDIVSRGFVYVREAEEIIARSKQVCKDALASFGKTGSHEWSNIKNTVKDRLSSYIYSKTKRSPMILPIIQDV